MLLVHCFPRLVVDRVCVLVLVVKCCCWFVVSYDSLLTVSLSVQFVQKKDPNYKEVKEDTAWSMDKFNQYFNEQVAPHKEIEEDWVYNGLTVSTAAPLRLVSPLCRNHIQGKFQIFSLCLGVGVN